MSREVGTLTPWMQVLTLRRLLQANSRALLHFAYRPDEGRLANVSPVKITGVSGLESTGRAGRFTGRVKLSLTQVTTQPPNEPTVALLEAMEARLLTDRTAADD
jgi:hypothetical protein